MSQLNVRGVNSKTQAVSLSRGPLSRQELTGLLTNVTSASTENSVRTSGTRKYGELWADLSGGGMAESGNRFHVQYTHTHREREREIEREKYTQKQRNTHIYGHINRY